MANQDPIPLAVNQALTQPASDEIQLGGSYYTNLSPGAVTYLDDLTKDHVKKLRDLAESLAQSKQVRGMPLEIIPEHLEAAKTIIQTTPTSQGKLLPMLRFLQFALPLLTGVAGSYLANLSMRPLFIGLFVASIAVYLVVELESRRGI